MSDQNREIVRRYFSEMVNAGRLEIVEALFSEDVIFETPFGCFEGPAGLRTLVGAFRAAFSDLDVEVEEILGEGDRLVVRVTTSGTNDGELMGRPPTGRQVRVPFVHFMDFHEGKCHRAQVISDRMALMEQLRLVEEPA